MYLCGYNLVRAASTNSNSYLQSFVIRHIGTEPSLIPRNRPYLHAQVRKSGYVKLYISMFINHQKSTGVTDYFSLIYCYFFVFNI